MHYFTFDLGDYAKDTEHLTALEHGIYMMLLRWYYANERPVPDNMATRITREPGDRVHAILEEFFDYDEAGECWHHKRADREIARVHGKSDKARASALARWGDRNADAPKPQPRRTATSTPQDLKNPPIPPKGDAEPTPKPKRERKAREPSAGPVEIQTFLANLQEGEKAFPPSDPLFAYARSVALPIPMVKLAWLVFVDTMRTKGKRQTDWRATFRNYVKKNYLKLWWMDTQGDQVEYGLTTAGKQAKEQFKDQINA